MAKGQAIEERKGAKAQRRGKNGANGSDGVKAKSAGANGQVAKAAANGKPAPKGPTIGAVARAEVEVRCKRVDEAIAHLWEILPKNVRTAQQQRTSQGKVSVKAEEAFGYTLDAAEYRPEVFVTRTDGGPEVPLDVAALRDLLGKHVSLKATVDRIKEFLSDASGSLLDLGEQLRPPLREAYTTAMPVAKRDAEFAKVLRGASDIFREGARTRAEQKSKEQAAQGQIDEASAKAARRIAQAQKEQEIADAKKAIAAARETLRKKK